jgi:hypothetical protein
MYVNDLKILKKNYQGIQEKDYEHPEIYTPPQAEPITMSREKLEERRKGEQKGRFSNFKNYFRS